MDWYDIHNIDNIDSPGLVVYKERIKDNIRENVPGLAFITQLKPVTYNLNIRKQYALNKNMTSSTKQNTVIAEEDFPGKYDIEKMTMTGFLAQEVEAAAKKSVSGSVPSLSVTSSVASNPIRSKVNSCSITILTREQTP